MGFDFWFDVDICFVFWCICYGPSCFAHMGCKGCLVIHRRLVFAFSLLNDGFHLFIMTRIGFAGCTNYKLHDLLAVTGPAS